MRPIIATTIFALALLPGCGSSNKKRNDLSTLHMLYQEYSNRNNKPPKSLADLKSVSNPDFDKSALESFDANYVLIWGVDFPSMGRAGLNKSEYVLGYEKIAPDDGGYVLFCDGTVKKLSADEFKQAKKAKPAEGDAKKGDSNKK